MGSECRDAGIDYIDQRAAGLRLCLFDTAARPWTVSGLSPQKR